jgi:hypothetical protein
MITLPVTNTGGAARRSGFAAGDILTEHQALLTSVAIDSGKSSETSDNGSDQEDVRVN